MLKKQCSFRKKTKHVFNEKTTAVYKYKLISRLNNFLKLVTEGERNHINT